MEKITTGFEFKLKKELRVVTIEECGEEFTPTMRVIKKCTSFIDDSFHNPNDEYEIKYASHNKDAYGKIESFAVNYSYTNEFVNTYISYSYFVVYNYITKTIKLDLTIRHDKNINASNIIQKLGKILDKITE